ncbi:hypothetical protein [Niastella sp. OAS944]|uniref:hypothetical protein n=1 Tax=Niastella sp. OAS944 TaxID=2664089 RepID=UPI0035C7A1BA|nr:hypothetical protein [Chitinophagaceae bacterium OAS944]
MKYIICALAITILAGSSCKSKSEPPIANEPEIVKENPVPQNPAPDNNPTKPADHDHHTCDKCDHEDKCHHHGHHEDECHHHDHHHCHHKKLPPGHEKKLHGDKSARKYAPGHKKH